MNTTESIIFGVAGIFILLILSMMDWLPIIKKKIMLKPTIKPINK